MKKVFFLSILLLSNYLLHADESIDSLAHVQLDEITVSAIRVAPKSSVAHSNISEQQIKSNNVGNNVPSLLQNLPSVVAYTEGGTPVGNTSFRIRGTDANRINMTLNGMTLNNPESQEVYWVNIPDLSSSLKNMQLQRGVGTATAGTASFGGNLSMQTVGGRGQAYADISNSFGQYNTYSLSVATGTGIMKNGLSVDARYSYVNSDGYIRNGKVDHRNLYASISHYTDKQMLQLIYINGVQHTGITWEGISPEDKAKDRRYNPAGEYKDENGKTQYYDNETDNYYSNVVQALYSRFINQQFKFNAQLGYNNGYGYYENYKADEEFKKMGLPNQIVNNVEYAESDLIRRKLMSNNLYSGGLNLNYRTSKLDMTLGANYMQFFGDHFGRLLWVKHNQNFPDDYQWYKNESKKKDFNSFLKATYNATDKLSLTAELQWRFVHYTMDGIDDDSYDMKMKTRYDFWNPKIGASYNLDEKNNIYASFAISNREPLRADLKESFKAEKSLNYEKLLDYEFGYRYTSPRLTFAANFYYMDYKDQFVQTGKLSDTGYKYQENVKNSYRYGVELEAMYNPTYWIGIGGNLTLSQNKIKDYTAYFKQYDNQKDWNKLPQATEFFKKTDISFSPNVTGNAIIKLKPLEKEDLTFTFTNRYVGKMYYDNTSNKDRQLPDYFITDFQASYSTPIWKAKDVTFQLMVNNLFNKKYDANAWVEVYKFADNTQITYRGLYPQAGTNVMGRISIHF